MRAALVPILLNGIHPAAMWWRRDVVAAGGLVSTPRLNTVSALIRGLDSDGVWSVLDRLWLFAAENSTQARRDLVARTVASPQNSPTFTANRGYTGDGVSSYVDTNFNPSTAGGKYTQNDASYGAWVETADGSPGTPRAMGNDGVNASELRISATNYQGGINSGAYTDSLVASTTTGLLVLTRPAASGVGSQNIYRNGGSLVAANQASTALPNRTFFVLATNQAGSVAGPSTSRIAAAFAGGSLTAAQVASLYARLRTYMTAVGVA